MVSITGGVTVITPNAVVAFSSVRQGKTRVHEVINRANPDATLRVAGSRAGRIKLAFTSASAEADSAAAEQALAGGALFTYVTDPSRPSLSMTFVVPDGGQINRVLSDVTRAAWTVEFDYREVSP